MAGTRWSIDEEIRLADYLDDGNTYKEISLELGRTVPAIQHKVKGLGLKSKNSKQKTPEQYKIDVTAVHKDKIKIIEDYKGAHTNILHECMICTYEWKVRPGNILQGQGCPKCAGKMLKTSEQYIKEVKAIHGTKIKVLEEYKGIATKILHGCEICEHKWSPIPNSILRWHGCPLCGGTMPKTQEEFNKQIPKGYSVLESYKNNRTKLLVEHISCGYQWKVSPYHLLAGQGCPKCAKSGFKKDKPAQLYVIEFDNNLYKIGISNNYKRRLKEFSEDVELIYILEFKTGKEALEKEKKYLDNVKDYLYNTGRLRSGNTETFIYN